MFEWIQVIAWLLPLIAVLSLKHKWLVLISVVMFSDGFWDYSFMAFLRSSMEVLEVVKTHTSS